MTKILIAGGSGLIGSTLCAALNKDGHEIVILTRTPDHRSPFVQYRWDPVRSYIDLRALRDTDVIINLCGAGIADKLWTRKRKEELADSRLIPTRFLHESIAKMSRKPSRYIGASAIGIYGDRQDLVLDENSEVGEDDFLVRLCKDWEHEHSRMVNLGLTVVVLRIGLVLSHRGGLVPKLMKYIILGTGVRLGSGNQFMAWIHEWDLVEMFRWHILGDHEGGIYNAVGIDPVTHATFMKRLVHKFPGLALLVPVPSWLIKLIMGEMAVTVLSSARVKPHRIMEQGFDLTYPEFGAALENVLNSKVT
ncbi:MAG: TIGR01777 family oxidoreductase [Saprospiraceae bacterium]|nr:TIGR01777 family oxidoreductase [Saprospiraceae bacterium]